MFIVINFVPPYFVLTGKRRKLYLVVSCTLSCLVLVVILSSHALKDRYVTELKEDLSPGFTGQTVEPRLERWKIAAGLIAKSPIMGYGAGSEVQLLQQKYLEKKFYSSYLHQLNAHNQYMSFMIKSGIWGLIIYLATLIYGFKIALRKRDVVFFSVMVLIAIVSLSEDLLNADKGVMFYSFFFSYFVFFSEQTEHIQLPLKGHKYLRNAATKQEVEP